MPPLPDWVVAAGDPSPANGVLDGMPLATVIPFSEAAAPTAPGGRIMAQMLDLLDLDAGARVLEIGTTASTDRFMGVRTSASENSPLGPTRQVGLYEQIGDDNDSRGS